MRRSRALPPGLAIRPMTADDADAVIRIYGEGIATGDATLETLVPPWERFDAGHLEAARLVAERDGSVVGWFALGAYSTRAVYAGVAWESVYVAEAARGTGIGLALLRAGVRAAEAAGIHSLLAGVLAENAASLAAHRHAGFRRIGVNRAIARDRAGRWRNVVQLERRSRAIR
jgi:L-amino acid N-acyltransferase YncA